MKIIVYESDNLNYEYADGVVLRSCLSLFPNNKNHFKKLKEKCVYFKSLKKEVILDASMLIKQNQLKRFMKTFNKYLSICFDKVFFQDFSLFVFKDKVELVYVGQTLLASSEETAFFNHQNIKVLPANELSLTLIKKIDFTKNIFKIYGKNLVFISHREMFRLNKIRVKEKSPEDVIEEKRGEVLLTGVRNAKNFYLFTKKIFNGTSVLENNAFAYVLVDPLFCDAERVNEVLKNLFNKKVTLPNKNEKTFFLDEKLLILEEKND